MARFLLDTQALIVLLTEGIEGFSKAGKHVLLNLDNDLVLSSISVSEVAVKTSIGKMTFTPEKVARAAADLRLSIIPYTPAHADQLFGLPLHHRDPFDRMLIATALAENIPIVAAERSFKRYRPLKVIW